MPQTQDITLDISTIIKEVENLHEVVTKELAKINTPRVFFTPVHDIDTKELAGGEETPTETLPEDGEMPLLLTQPPSQYSPPLEDPHILDKPPPRLCEYASAAVCLESKGNLPGYCVTAANDKLFIVDQDWVQQNSGTHLYGGIEEDGKWQQIC